MKNFIFLMAAILLIVSCNTEEERKPNIIFLFADDQRADALGANGNSYIKTPNLDRLAESGVCFQNNYCAGSFSGAVCVASRAMLMTGRHWTNLPGENKFSGWNDLPLLPSVLEEQGNYNSFIVGKWHNGQTTLQEAFSSGKAVYMGGMANHADFQVQDLVDGKLTEKRDAGGFSSEVYANAAIDFLEKQDADNPFFLYVAFTAPHDPRNPPEKYREYYYMNRPPIPENFLPTHPFKNAPMSTMGRDEGLAPWPRTKEVISDQLCEYYGLVSHLDEQVGRIMETLKNSRHAENTIVIYTADHGLAMGSHGLLGKQNIYEQSMKCPLIISGPGVPEKKTSAAFTYVHDLYATVCNFAGVALPEGVDSKNLSPIIRGEEKLVRESVFLPFQDNQRSIYNGKWKLHVYPLINHRLLFDLENDPHETNNLASNSEFQLQSEKMMKLMEKWRSELGDTAPLSVKNPEPREVNYGELDRKLDVWQPKWIRDKYFDGREDTNHGQK